MNNLRVCIHWTAGNLNPSSTDIEAYHFIVDGNGKVHKGRYSIEDNLHVWYGKRHYAKHCGGGNSKTFGIAVTGSGVNWHPPLMTRVGFEAMLKKVAELCFEYSIPIQPSAVYTHYEFGLLHPHTSSANKIDIYKLPWEPDLKKEEVGNYIRNKVKWYFERL